MAIELNEYVATKLLEVKVSGKLSKEDYERFEPAVAKLITNSEKIRILFIMSDFHGW